MVYALYRSLQTISACLLGAYLAILAVHYAPARTENTARAPWPSSHIRLTFNQIGSWNHLHLTQDQARYFLMALQYGDPKTTPYLAQVSSKTDVYADAETVCPPNASCAMIRHSQLSLHFQPSVLSAAPDSYTLDSHRFVIWHEFGHLVRFAGIQESALANWQGQSMPAKCVQDEKGKCVNTDELFADNFAMWATHWPGQKAPSTYNTPHMGQEMSTWLLANYDPGSVPAA